MNTKEHLIIIISPQTLKEWQGDSSRKILLLDLSENANYQRGTIANAVNMPYAGLVNGEFPNPGMLPQAADFATALAAVGYDGSQHLVAFDDEFGMKAARLYWTLRMAGDGRENFSYLNGGVAAWQNSDGEVSSGGSARPTEVRSIEWDTERGPRATREQILASLPQQEYFLWDTRSAGEYSGEEKRAERAGHIPGARHLEWSSLLNQDGTIKPAAEARGILEKFFEERKDAQPIVVYCQAHRRSSLAFMVADFVGIEVLGYDGSWQEWGNLPDTPIETTVG